MGTKIEKHAILINGDQSSSLSNEHQQNIKVMGQFFKEGGYQIWELQGQKATQSELLKVLSGIKKKMDGDDELVIYVTGHGDNQNNEEVVVIDEGQSIPLEYIERKTRQLGYKERLVWVDSCFGGGALRYFSPDPKTLFIAAGSKEETVQCYHFTRPAIEMAEDLNRDGNITYGERFVAAATNVAKVGGDFRPIFFIGNNYVDDGITGKAVTPKFPPVVVEVENKEELIERLAHLKPGEMAIVDFSADWCDPCKEFKPKFEEMARRSGGNYLWIKAEGVDEDWAHFGVKGFPTVKIFQFGDVEGFHVQEREEVEKWIPMVLLDKTLQEKAKISRMEHNLESGSGVERIKAIIESTERGEMATKYIPELLENLKDEDPSIRREAIRALGIIARNDDYSVTLAKDELSDPTPDDFISLPTEMFQELIAATLMRSFEDPDAWVRLRVVEALRFFKNPDKKMEFFMRAFNDPYPHVREQAARALMEGPQKVPTLIQALKDPNASVREAAAELAGWSKVSQTVPILEKLLKDKSSSVRVKAAEALGRIKDPKAISALIRALKDPHGEVRVEVIVALEKMMDHRKLASLLVKHIKDPSPMVRLCVGWFFMEQKDPRGIPMLIEGSHDPAASIRKGAVKVLGKTKDPQVIPTLIQALQDPNEEVRRKAVHALRRFKEDQIITAALTKTFKDPNPRVREAIVSALGEMNAPESLPLFMEALKDKDPSVRVEAVRQLEEIKDPRVLPLLTGALKDESPDVRKQAVISLGKIKDPQAIPALKEALNDTNDDVRSLVEGVLVTHFNTQPDSPPLN